MFSAVHQRWDAPLSAEMGTHKLCDEDCQISKQVNATFHKMARWDRMIIEPPIPSPPEVRVCFFAQGVIFV